MKQSYTLITCLVFLFSSAVWARTNTIFDGPPTISKDIIALTATISGTTSVCIDTPVEPIITFTGSGGTAPYTFTYKVNNGSNLTVVSTGSTAIVSAPTNIVGTFTYTLINVADSTTGGTIETASGNATITIVPDFDVTAMNNIIVCKGGSINLSASVSNGAPSGITYSWSGPNNYNSSSQSPTINNATSAMTGNYTVTASIGQCQKTDVMHVTVLEPTVVSSNLQEYQGADWLVKCTPPGATNGVIFVNNGIPSNLQNLVTSYTINWGDNSTAFTSNNSDWNNGNNLNHSYGVGLYTLTISISTTLGCNINKTYTVFVGNQPASPQIQLPINAQGCVPFELTFPISGVSANTPGTTYTITFSDDPGNPLHFNQNNIPASITRTFTTSSCNHTFTNGSNIENNAYGVSMQAVNPCGSASSSAGPIRTSTPPTAIVNGPATGCINQTVTISDQSINGSIVTSSSCNVDSGRYWEISPSTGWTLNTSNLGNTGGFPDDYEGWNNGSQNLNIVFSVAGTYTLTLHKRNSCAGTSTVTKIICIDSPLSPTFTKSATEGCSPLTITTSNTTNIANQCSTPTYNWTVTYSNTGCGNSNPTWNYTNGTSSSSANPSFNFVTPGTYTIRLAMNNGCGTVQSATQTVTVKAPPTVTINTIPNVCGGTSATINPIANVTNCGTQGITYAWSFPSGTPATSNNQNPGTISYSSPGPYTVTLSVTNECGTTESTRSFTVTPAVIANAGNDATVCSGATQLNGIASGGSGSGYTYSWSPSTGLSNANIANPSANPTTTTTYTLTVTNGSCTAIDQVIVNKNTVTAGAISGNQTICVGGDPVALTVATAATGGGAMTYQWEVSTISATSGYTDINGATSATYDPSVTTVPTWYRRKAISTLNGLSCDATGNFIEITINTVSPGTISGDQTICVGGNPAAFTTTNATGSGTISYQWQSSVDNATFTNISGATSATYDAPSISQTTYYKRVAKSTFNTVQCTQESNVITVSVIPLPVVTTQPQASQTVCQDTAPTSLQAAAAGGTGTFSYQWYVSNNPGGTGGTAISSATQSTYSPPTNQTGTKYYYCIISQMAPGCSVTTSIVQVQVIASPAINQQPASSTVCTGGTPTQLTVSYINGIGTPSYQWYSNTSNTTTGGTAIATATTNAYQPVASAEGVYYYYVVITFGSGGCSSVTSTVATVTVNPLPQIVTHPAAQQTICVGGSVSPLTVAGNTTSGTPSYQWYSNTTSTATGGTIISGATSATYTPPAYNTAGNYYYYAVVSYGNNGCGTITSNVAAVNVVADPVISVQPIATQSLCQNPVAAQISLTASGGVGSLSYQWYSNTVNSTSGGTAIASANTAAYTPPATNVGTTYYYCIVTTSASGCSVTSSTSQVIVLSAPVVSTQPQPQTLCFGATPAALSVAYINGTGTPAYQWYSNTSNSTTGGTLLNGATNASYQPSGATAGVLYYYVQITFATGGCSVITSNAVAVTINPLPSVTSTQSTTICSGETFTITPQDGNGNSIPTGTQYTWTVPANNNITGESNQPTPQSSISQALTNTSNAPVTLTYTVIPVANGCSGSSFTVTVTVNPKPFVVAQAATICSGETFNVAPANGGGNIVPAAGVTYSWNAPATGTGITGAVPGTDAANIGGTLINTTNVAQTATYTVTPKWTLGSEMCMGASFTVTVTVNPKPTISTISQNACSGSPFTITPVNGTNGSVPPGTTYSWMAPAAQSGVTGLAAGNNSTVISATITNTNTTPVTVTYVVTPVANGCLGDSFNVMVTVAPTPTVASVSSQTVCNQSATSAVAFSGTVGGTVFNWQNSNPSVGLAASGSGDIGSFTATNAGTAPVTATITVTPRINNCDGAPQTFTITVNPAPSVLFSQNNQTICSGTASTAVNLTSATANTSITWTANIPAGISGATASGTTSIPAQTLVNTTNGVLTVTYTAIAATSGTSTCPGAPSIYTITVTPVPFVSGTEQVGICSGTSPNYIPANSGGNNMPTGVTFTWLAPTGTGFTGGSAQNTPQPSLNQVLVNTTNVPVIASYIVTPHFGGCNGVPFTIQVTVNPTATVPNTTRTLCSGTSFTFDPSSVATIFPANTVFNWSAPTGNVSGGTAGSAQSIIAGTLTNTTASVQPAVYTITPLSPQGNCNGASFTLTVNVNPVFDVTSVVSNYNGFQISSAGANDGSINITPTGGTGSYTYSWSGPNGFAATTQDITNLGPGTYTVVVSDGLCQDITRTFTLIEPMPLVIAEVSASHVNVNCFGQSTGVLEVVVTQESIGPYDYAILLANGTVVENVDNLTPTNYIFDNLPAGTYNIRVTDANGTVKFINGIQITQPATGLAITGAAVPNFNGFSISCNGANNGTIDLTVSGGYPGYTYSWTGPNGFTATTQDISGLAPGNYSVTVLDTTNSCPVTQNFTITEPLPVAFTGVMSAFNGYQISCFGGNNGSITITPTGGTGVYIYTWNGPNGFTASSQNLTGISVGTYTLTISDNNGCTTAAQTFTLTQPAALARVESHVNVLCFGAATGSIDVTVTGGVPDNLGGYDYTWTGPNGFASTSEDLANITAGIYNMVATDENGCTITLSVTITGQPEIIITPTTTPITCYGANNASITLAITGGNPPYTAAWSNLATGTFQDNLAAGNYVIIITDESGCQKSITVVIPEAPIFTVNPVVHNISCHGANDGSIALNLIGGIAPVTLAWSDGSTQGTTRNNLGPGTYTATITDGTPCQIVRTFTIIEPATLNVGANLTHALDCNDAQTGAINLTVAGGTLPYTFIWSNGETTEDLNGLTSGTYSVTVTDAGGCAVTRTYTITRPDPIILNVTSDLAVNCDAHTVHQTNIAQASGGVPPFHYTWTSGAVSGPFGQYMNTDQNGTVIVTATDSSGCSATTTFEVATDQLGEADFTAGSYAFTTYSSYSIFDPVTFDNLSSGDYSEVGWDFGDGTSSNDVSPTHTYVKEGIYIVKLHVVYSYGCTDVYVMTLVVTKGYDVMVPNAFTPDGNGVNDTFVPVHKGLKSIELKIFDTWGELVYSEKGETLTGWNGDVKKIPAENGNFYYRVKAETFYGHIIELDGPLVLIK